MKTLVSLAVLVVAPLLAGHHAEAGSCFVRQRAVALGTVVPLVTAHDRYYYSVGASVREEALAQRTADRVLELLEARLAAQGGRDVAARGDAVAARGLQGPRGTDAPQINGVQEILHTRCAKCHGGGQAAGGIRFWDEAGALHKLPRHTLLERVTAEDASLRMPKGGDPLSAEELDVLRQWEQDKPRDLVW